MERIGNERTGCSNIVLPVAAGQEIMPGTMVALNADGLAVPGFQGRKSYHRRSGAGKGRQPAGRRRSEGRGRAPWGVCDGE